MARKNASLSRLQAELRVLDATVPEDLFLPSLRASPQRVQGFAFRYFLILPLYASDGRRVFTEELLTVLYREFDKRFGGCLASTSLSGAPFFGEYLPEGNTPIRDYHTVTIVYCNPIEPSDRFFKELKEILRRAPLIQQDEILIERSEVYLV